MSDFEDREVRDQLQRMGGRGPESDEAYARLQIGVRRAHRRRAVSVLTGLGLTVVLAFSAAVYANRSHSQVTPADGGTDSAITTGNSELTTDDTQPDDSVTVSAPQKSGEDTSGSPGTQKPDSSSGNPTPAGPTPGGRPANQPPTPTTDVESPVVDETKTAMSPGGSITVSLHNGVLTLVSHSANSGYSYQLEDSEPENIRVRFENSNGHSRIEATIAQDGHINFAVSESYSGSDDTSGTTSP